MSNKKDETASFMIRFTQKIYDTENGSQDVQWRGNIRHVQSGNENKFVDINEALSFIQTNLAELTKQSIVDRSPEEQKGILSKSFGIWKKVTTAGPKLVMDTLRDPLKQVENVQEQLHDTYESVKEEINKKLDLDHVLSMLGKDSDKVLDRLESLSSEINKINKKIDKLQKSIK